MKEIFNHLNSGFLIGYNSIIGESLGINFDKDILFQNNYVQTSS